uniref:Adhesin domain-containing protein n=1 Tax=uncultured bacterium BLR19 TaxID=506519 RepID=C0INY0_9BACT|nr:hypothetical protein AKSOIL_0308 [uncultured bacterium BLR19]
MKKLFLIISLISVSACFLQAQTSGEFVVPLSDPAKRGKLRAHINYGSITVKGTARKDVLIKYSGDDDDNDRGKDDDKSDRGRVRVNVNVNKDDEKQSTGKEGLKKISGSTLDLEASENANMVKVNSGSWGTKINLDIEVPAGFDVQMHTYNDGELVINNVQGELELNNYNGDITASAISGSAVATSYNGEIKISFDKVTEGSPMSFTTYNGDIDLTFPAALKASLKMKQSREKYSVALTWR